MAVKSSDKGHVTSEELQLKQTYDEYKELKLLLDYVRSSEAQRILQEKKVSLLGLPKPTLRRRSRI